MKVFASILSADLLNLSTFIDRVTAAGVDGIHLDFMDHHYVQNLAFGPEWIKQIRSYTNLPIHVHAMMTQMTADKCLRWFEYGASALMLHPETWADSDKAWQEMCEQYPIYAVINPHPNRIDVSSMAMLCRGLLIMSVHPGRGGQKFIPSSLQAIPAGFDEIWVDGGVGPEQCELLLSKDFHGVVLGSALNHHNMKTLIQSYQNDKS